VFSGVIVDAFDKLILSAVSWMRPNTIALLAWTLKAQDPSGKFFNAPRVAVRAAVRSMGCLHLSANELLERASAQNLAPVSWRFNKDMKAAYHPKNRLKKVTAEVEEGVKPDSQH
jgi:hypothetical protein